jgi:hypothetical protein
MHHHAVIVGIGMVAVRIPVTGGDVKLNVPYHPATVRIFKHRSSKIRPCGSVLHSGMHNAVFVTVSCLKKFAESMGAAPQFGKPSFIFHRMSRCINRI